MPIYEFTCKACNNTLEVRHRTLNGVACPADGCDGELRRVWHAPDVQFKADGFYATRDDVSGKFQAERRRKRAEARRKGQAPDDA